MQILPGDGDTFIFISEANHHQVSKLWLIFHISQYVSDSMKAKPSLGLKHKQCKYWEATAYSTVQK